VVVSLYTIPAISYTIDNNSGCSPVNVTFTNTTNPALVSSADWNFGDGGSSSGNTVTHVFTGDDCYDITLNVTTVNGCSADTTILNQICVYPNPIAEFSFAPQPTTVLNPEISFTNLTSNGNTYNWNFAGLGTSNASNPSYSFPYDSGGVYNVCLNAISINGCVDTICHTVEILDEFLFYAPNAFTPDGDGVNDIFKPVIQGFKPDSYQLMIFNRWGELIFQSNNVDIGWDGTHKNMKAKEDTYVWKVTVKKLINEDKKSFTGHVNLLR
jgi:gliding motility-associated-like protein